jgi:hypothetical protein
MREIIERLLEIESSLTTPDCGDNSCDFATDKSGMRTNGGCRCGQTRSNLYFRKLHLMKKDIRPLLLRMKALEDVAEAARELLRSNDLLDRESVLMKDVDAIRSTIEKLDEARRG